MPYGTRSIDGLSSRIVHSGTHRTTFGVEAVRSRCWLLDWTVERRPATAAWDATRTAPSAGASKSRKRESGEAFPAVFGEREGGSFHGTSWPRAIVWDTPSPSLARVVSAEDQVGCASGRRRGSGSGSISCSVPRQRQVLADFVHLSQSGDVSPDAVRRRPVVACRPGSLWHVSADRWSFWGLQRMQAAPTMPPRRSRPYKQLTHLARDGSAKLTRNRRIFSGAMSRPTNIAMRQRTRAPRLRPPESMTALRSP